jgi:hypothetical protein
LDARIDIYFALFPQIQFVDQLLVAFGLGPAQIIEQAPALGHHLKEASARGVVFGVAFQVFGQLPDSARQQRDLHIGAARVLPVQLELLDIQRFRVLSHFEAPILDEVCGIATAS